MVTRFATISFFLRSSHIHTSKGLANLSSVLIETLREVEADIRCYSYNIYGTEDHAASAIPRDDESMQDYWECFVQAITGIQRYGPDLVFDDGGNATLFFRECTEAENQFLKDGALLDPSVTDNADFFDYPVRP